MGNKSYVPPEAKWVLRVRDVSGAIALIGVGILGGFALTNLRTGWQWMRQDEQVQGSTETGSH